jgi:serine phosphatase RsbU (regulator of sigma subunit)
MKSFFQKKLSLFLICVLGMLQATQAQDDISYKSNYIQRFANSVIWPSWVVGNDFVVGVLGNEDAVAGITRNLGSQSVKNKRFKVKHFATFDEIETCPIVYITESNRVPISGIMQKLARKPVLIITEMPGFAERGGSDINFVKSGTRWLYEVNPTKAPPKNIILQDAILKGAIRVIGVKEEIVVSNNNKEPPKTVNNPNTDARRADDLTRRLTELQDIRKRELEKLNSLDPKLREKYLKQIAELENIRDKDSLINSQLQATQKAYQDSVARSKAERRELIQLQQTTAANQRTQLTILIGILLLVSSLAAVFYYFSVRRKKTLEQVRQARNALSEKVDEINEKNSQLDFKNKEIEQKNEELTAQTDKLEEQNRKITDSIRYALTIQKAMLPGERILSEAFTEHFVIYEPKDIVSGDFYWISRQEGRTFVAVVDCTGHGVPGAFMSAIGTDVLNEVVNEKHNFSPATILELLHIGIFDRLRQGDSNNRDGMDVCICMIRPANNDQVVVTFSGAKRPLYYTQDRELKRISGDSKYIGGIRNETQAFTNYEILLKKGDVLYLTSDGYMDAPNADRRKLGTQRFQEILEQVREYPLDKQRELLMAELTKHRGETESRDDITVLGVKV